MLGLHTQGMVLAGYGETLLLVNMLIGNAIFQPQALGTSRAL